jgi:2'-5' RNA ligase
MLRLFTALEIPGDIADELELLRGGVDGARWIDRENYHITLRFVGDVGSELAGDLDAALCDLEVEPFELELSGVGEFGGTRPRAVWAGVAASVALENLQSGLENLCRRIGLPSESRRFAPHVTLARVRNGDSVSVQEFIARNNLYRSRRFGVERFVLMSSRPSRGGGPYVVEQDYSLVDSMWSASP